ncbi:hypothetical protein DHEL01_v207780 [Diaporthe helianthi]|uniref:Uncharacterized protein n=1 Tax=Diaporthe helianthi TaxID=158607 RepID=A0A2P5HUA6_DIAHE|nr:hypothetical protein DHEL01_v207780 [Diaporthe helianthi]
MRKYSSMMYGVAAALPFLVLSAGCYILMDVPRLMQLWQPAFDSDRIEWDNSNGGGSIPLLRAFYHVGFLDWYWRGLTVTFAPATLGVDPIGWWTGFQFLTQLAPLYATWMLDASRNRSGPKRFTTLFMFLGQVFGTGVIVPVFHLFEFICGDTPADLVASPTRTRRDIQSLLCYRTTPPFLPLLLLLHLLPVAGAFCAPQLQIRHICVWFWFLVPVWIGLGNKLLTRLSILGSKNTPSSPVEPTRRAAVVAQRHLIILTGLSAGVWIYMLASAPYSLHTILVPKASDLAHSHQLLLRSRLIWQADFLCTFGSTAVFIAYQHAGHHRAGLLHRNDWLLPAFLPAVTAVGGPGTAVAAAWLWKETIMLRTVL